MSSRNERSFVRFRWLGVRRPALHVGHPLGIGFSEHYFISDQAETRGWMFSGIQVQSEGKDVGVNVPYRFEFPCKNKFQRRCRKEDGGSKQGVRCTPKMTVSVTARGASEPLAYLDQPKEQCPVALGGGIPANMAVRVRSHR
jgi:hypothetical protein